MTVHPGLSLGRGRRRFFTGLALAIAITVFAGFAPIYYLRFYFTHTPLAGLLHLHGVFFTAWVLLFLVRSTLIAGGRTGLHRRLGVAGAVLAALLVAVGRRRRSPEPRMAPGRPACPRSPFWRCPSSTWWCSPGW